MKVRIGWGPLLNRAAAEADGGRFDWSGVVVGHWRADGPEQRGKGGRLVYRCVSRCGVVSVFRRSDLAAGATLTCEACRAGTPPPPAARVTEVDDRPARAKWEAPTLDEKSNIKGREALQEWAAKARPALAALLDRSGLGAGFGFKVFVRDCHYRPKPAGDRSVLRVRSAHDAQRRLELLVAAAGGVYQFEVDLATGRTDRPWDEVRRAIEAAAAEYGPPPEPAAPAPPSQPPAIPAPPDPPRGEAILGGIDLSRLIRLREGFDTLISVGRDVASAAEMKRELAGVVAARRAAAEPLRAAVEAAAAVADRVRAGYEAAKETAARLHRELQEAVGERDRLADEAEAQAAARDRAIAAYAPARDALAAAERGLAETERLEEERMRTLAKADDVAVLLAALQKLSA